MEQSDEEVWRQIGFEEVLKQKDYDGVVFFKDYYTNTWPYVQLDNNHDILTRQQIHDILHSLNDEIFRANAIDVLNLDPCICKECIRKLEDLSYEESDHEEIPNRQMRHLATLARANVNAVKAKDSLEPGKIARLGDVIIGIEVDPKDLPTTITFGSIQCTMTEPYVKFKDPIITYALTDVPHVPVASIQHYLIVNASILDSCKRYQFDGEYELVDGITYKYPRLDVRL